VIVGDKSDRELRSHTQNRVRNLQNFDERYQVGDGKRWARDARKTWNVRVAMQLGQAKRKVKYST
jgi:hypothetical protein